MEVEQIMRDGAFDSDELKVLLQVFDEVWQEIELRFGGDHREDARAVLAHAVLGAATAGTQDRERIKASAVATVFRALKRPRAVSEYQ